MYIYVHFYRLLCLTYAVPYVGTLSNVPDMPNIHNIWVHIGHRFGHQAGLDKSSGRNSTTFVYGIEFQVFWGLQRYAQSSDIPKNVFVKHGSFWEKRLPQACSAVNRVWGYQYTSKCNLY